MADGRLSVARDASFVHNTYIIIHSYEYTSPIFLLLNEKMEKMLGIKC